MRNAQRYITFLMRMGFNQDQIKVVVNQYTKKINWNHASLEQIQQTLNQPIFYGIPVPRRCWHPSTGPAGGGQSRTGGRPGPRHPRVRG